MADRWWCSWHGPEDDWRPVLWPMPAGWLGVWCSGYGDDYSTIVGWIEAESPEECAKLVLECWPEWDGEWRIEPDIKPDPPGDRFPLPSWSPALDEVDRG